MQSFRLILASQSPRRRQLLSAVGYEFEVMPPDESAESGALLREAPSEFVARMASQKAADVAPLIDQGLVLACDTVAECGGKILGKPRDRDHARSMLQQMNGQHHHVYSGVCLWRRPDDYNLVRVAATKLRMAQLSDRELEAYLDTGGWKGKAGAFGYQDELGWIEILAGSESNVVGLPMEMLADMIAELQRI